jgi:hypothetical protein
MADGECLASAQLDASLAQGSDAGDQDADTANPSDATSGAAVNADADDAEASGGLRVPRAARGRTTDALREVLHRRTLRIGAPRRT